MRRRLLAPALAVLIVALPACSAGEPDGDAAERDSLTRRQKDSAVAESGLPGARGVGQAQEASDEARERAARLDSVDSE